MKYLVTGANGFIGSYLCNYLLKNGHQVIALSRSFFPEIKTLLQGAQFIEADVLSTEFEKIKTEADVIVHLATSNDIVSKNLSKGIELSTAGTVNMLKFAVNNTIPKFIFYSTLQVYGTELSGNYAMNHLFGEMYVEMFSRKYGLKTLVVRPSNIYGRFLSSQINRWSLVPGCFVKEALEKGTITLLSSGNQNRNFISLEQLSYCTELCALNMIQPFDILNFVSNDYKRIIDLALLTQEIFKKELNREIEMRIQSNRPVDTNQFQFSEHKLLTFGIDMNNTENHSLETEIKSLINLTLQEIKKHTK